MAWSPCGAYIATVCKDGHVRIFEPRKGGSAIRQGSGPSGVKGARIIWALDGKFLLVSGFDRYFQNYLCFKRYFKKLISSLKYDLKVFAKIAIRVSLYGPLRFAQYA